MFLYEDHKYKGQVGSVKQSKITRHFVGFSHDIGYRLTVLVLMDDKKMVISRSRVMLINIEEKNLKLDDDLGKLPNWVYVWLMHDGKEDYIKLPMIDVNFCPYNIEYDSDDHNQLASDKVPELAPWGCDHGNDDEPVSSKKGENKSVPVMAMKGEMHDAKETVDAQGETKGDDKLPHLIP